MERIEMVGVKVIERDLSGGRGGSSGAPKVKVTVDDQSGGSQTREQGAPGVKSTVKEGRK
jgi:hypothetical protein